MNASTHKQLDEIGTRYIRRALTQLNDVKALVIRIHEGDHDCIANLDHLTHQLYGTAAMFGFTTVSNTAGRINKLLKSFQVYPSKWNLVALDLLMIELGDAVHEAASARNRRSADLQRQWPDQG